MRASPVDVTAVFVARGHSRAVLTPLRAFAASIAVARRAGIGIDVRIIDHSDSGLSPHVARVFDHGGESQAGLPVSHYTDARSAFEEPMGSKVAIVSGDSLISSSWLLRSVRESDSRGNRTVVHSQYLVGWGHPPRYHRQPSSPVERVPAEIAIRDLWGGCVVLPRDLLLELGPSAIDEVTESRVLTALSVGVGAAQVVAAETLVVSKTLPRASVEPPLLVPVAILDDRDVARSLTRTRVTRPSPSSSIRARVKRAIMRRLRRLVPARSRAHTTAPRWVIDELVALNRIEPAVPFPEATVPEPLVVDSPFDIALERDRAGAYWELRAVLPDVVDYLFLAPWVRTGGGDLVLSRYLEAVRRLSPTASVVVMTTESEPSTRLDLVPEGVTVIELRDYFSFGADREWMAEHTLPQLIAQVAPGTVHAFNSTLAYDVIESYGDELAATSSLFLSTFVVDRTASGERTSVLFYRRPDFLDPVSAVLVDSEAFVATMSDDWGYDARKFVVVRNIVDSTPAIARVPRPISVERPLRVLWAGRFDVQKRLDILARVAEEASARRIPVEFHFSGEGVMGDPGRDASLATLERCGAVRYPPYRGKLSALPLDEFDIFLMTSEWEGVPNALLEAMEAGLPVIVPMVGGIAHVVDSTVGYPIQDFADIEAYLDVFHEIIDDPRDAIARGVAGRALVTSRYSRDSFDAQLRAVEGYVL